MHTNAAPLPPDAVSIRPLLKWAGGKTQLLGEILPKIPKKYGRFIEPFFGGGAVFLQYGQKMESLQIAIQSWLICIVPLRQT